MILTLAMLLAALLFGGMILYAFGFAVFLFSALPPEIAGQAIPQAFPHFYSFVMATGLAAAGLTWPRDPLSGSLLILIALTTLPVRQILMPAVNRATDSQAKTQFKWLHGASVVLTLGHIVLAGVVLARFV